MIINKLPKITIDSSLFFIQIASAEEEVRREWREKHERLLASERERHERTLGDVQEEKQGLEQKIQTLEGRVR